MCTGWGGPEPWNPVTGFKPAGASLLKAVGSFWGEDSRDLSLSLDRKSCGFCYYQLEMLPIRRVVADSIGTDGQCLQKHPRTVRGKAKAVKVT